MRADTLARAVAFALIVAGTSILAAPAQTTAQPGQMTQAHVWVQNRGRSEAIPVDVREVNLDAPLRVQVTNGRPSQQGCAPHRPRCERLGDDRDRHGERRRDDPSAEATAIAADAHSTVTFVTPPATAMSFCSRLPPTYAMTLHAPEGTSANVKLPSAPASVANGDEAANTDAAIAG